MNISIRDFKVDGRFINPTLLIELTVQYYVEYDLLISISGILSDHNGKMLGILLETQVNYAEKIEMPIFTRNRNTSETRTISLICNVELTTKAIDYIEEIRNKTSDKSIKFRLNIITKKISFSTITSNNHLQLENIILIPSSHSVDCEIKQSDWATKFAPMLGIGHIAIVEIPEAAGREVPEYWKDLFKRIMPNIDDMKTNINKGEWESVMLHGRKFYENLKVGDKKKTSEEFKVAFTELMKKDQHSDIGIQEFFDGIYKFFEFTSKYIHDKDKKGNFNIIPIYTKEDAYFIYTMAVGLANIIGKKISKV